MTRALIGAAMLQLLIIGTGADLAWGQNAPVAAQPAAAVARPVSSMTPDEARRILTEVLPADATRDARMAYLLRQREAARMLGDRAASLRAIGELVELSKGTPAWGAYVEQLAGLEYSFGSQQRALQLGEALIGTSDISPEVRSLGTSRLAWHYLNLSDLINGPRVYEQAERAYTALPPSTRSDTRDLLLGALLRAKSEQLRVRGDLEGSTRAARESLLAARRYAAAMLAAAGNDRNAGTYRYAVNEMDFGGGILVYALIRQGRSAEAVAIAQEGLTRARLDDLGPDSLAGWHHRLASAYLPQRRYAEALQEAQASLAELARAGSQATSAQEHYARYAATVALIALERWGEADASYTAYLESIRSDRTAYDRAYDARLLALLAAKNNRAAVAMEMIERNYRFRSRLYGLKHPLTMETRGVRGTIELINGSVSAALSDYDDLFSALLDTPSGWSDLDPAGRRGIYLQIALDEFLRYVAGSYRTGGATAVDRRVFDRLVQVTDRLSTGVVHQSIVDSTARVLAGKPELAALLAREQELRNQLREQYDAVTEALGRMDNKELSDDKRKQAREQQKQLRDNAEATTKQLADLRGTISDKFPEYVALVSPVSPAPDALQKTLAPGEVFVTIYPTSFATFVWAVGANGERGLHVSQWTARDLDARAAALRAMLDLTSAAGGRAPAFDYKLAYDVYRELIAPIRPALQGATSMIVATHGALAAVPLASLLTAPSQELRSAAWLVRDMAVTQVPDAASFAALRRAQAAATAAQPLIGFGDPLFDPTLVEGKAGAVRSLVVNQNADKVASYTVEQGFQYSYMPPLPETRDELLAIAAALGANPARDLVFGAQATRKAVLSADLADRRVVAFATHGLLPGNIPGLSKPALAMAAVPRPDGQDSAIGSDDSPLLTLDDVLTLKLNAQWVVLSACNTAGGEQDGVAMSGLVRGFLFAGTRSVLATHWAVDSAAAQVLVTQVFSDYAKNPSRGRAANLREAQLAMIDGKLGKAAYAHPFYWAPYALFGDPAR